MALRGCNSPSLSSLANESTQYNTINMIPRVEIQWGESMKNLTFYTRQLFLPLLLTGLTLFGLALGGCETKENPDEISTQFAFGVEKQPKERSRYSTTNAESQPTRIQRPEESWPRIVAFGDSLTAGLGISSDQSYPAQLQERLLEADYHYVVINAGVSGDTTAGGLRRLDWILKSRPTIVILELGANDGLRGFPLDETYANLEKIIQRLKTERVTILLAGMKIPPNYGEAYTSEFSAIYEILAKKYDVELMPFFLKLVSQFLKVVYFSIIDYEFCGIFI